MTERISIPRKDLGQDDSKFNQIIEMINSLRKDFIYMFAFKLHQLIMKLENFICNTDDIKFHFDKVTVSSQKITQV